MSITRSTKFAVYFHGLDKQAHRTLTYDLARAQSEITRASNKIARILYLVERNNIPWPTNDQNALVPWETLANSLVRQKDPWMPDGRPTYQPDGPRLAAANCAMQSRSIAKAVKTALPEINKGKQQLLTFRLQPLPIRASNIKISTTEDHVLIDLGLWSAGHPHVLLEPILGSREHGQREVLNRILTGQYTHGDAKLYKDERKGKWMLSLSWTGETTARSGDYIAGIDLGLLTTASIAYISTQGQSMLFRDRVTIPRTVLDAWKAVESERRSRLRGNRLVFDHDQPGRGLDRKMRPISILEGKKSRLVEEAVRQVAAACVRSALKRGCTTIAIEDLSWSHEHMLDQTEGLSAKARAHQRNNFLLWQQGKLRAQIKSVGEREGLTVIEVNARDSSNTCGACGLVWKRPPRPTAQQHTFRPYCKDFAKNRTPSSLG